MKYQNDEFLGLFGWAELEWIFHILLEKADEEGKVTLEQVDEAIIEFRDKYHKDGMFFFSWLCNRGDVIPVDRVSSATGRRYIYKLKVPDKFKLP